MDLNTARTRHPWKILSLMLTGAFMALLDVTIVNVALPDIQAGIMASSSVLIWIVSAYALAFGVVLIPSGRFGDKYGHNVTYVAGLAIFTVASLGSGLAQNEWEIIAARTIQGLGAGIFVPAIRSAIRLMFEGRDQAKAFSALGTVIGASTALGPLIGGILIRYAGWRWVFFVNLPIGIALVPLAWKVLPRMRQKGAAQGFDPLGIVLLSVGLFLLLFPLVEGQSARWTLWIWLVLGAGVVVLAALWRWARRQEHRGVEPIVPPRLLSIRSFGIGTLLATFYFAGFTSIFFVFSLLWQEGLGHSALVTGLTILPFALCNMLTSSVSHRLSERLGRNVLFVGCGLLALGLGSYLLALHMAGTAINEWWLIGPFAVAGCGNGLFIAPNQNFIMAGIDPVEAGTASGILSTAQRIGSAIGIAGVGSIYFSVLYAGGRGQVGADVFIHAAVSATFVNLAFVIVVFLLVFASPVRTRRTNP